MIKVAQRMENALISKDNKAIQDLVDSLNNDLKRSSTRSINALILIMLTIIGWVLARLGYINEWEACGIKMSGKILLLALPVMTAFLYYCYQCQMLFSSFIEDALFKYYEKKQPNISKNNLELLTVPPTIFNIEAVLGKFSGYKNLGKLLSMAWFCLLCGCLVLIPFLYLVAVGFDVYYNLNFPLYQKLISLTIVGLFGVRGLLMFVQWLIMQR